MESTHQTSSLTSSTNSLKQRMAAYEFCTIPSMQRIEGRRKIKDTCFVGLNSYKEKGSAVISDKQELIIELVSFINCSSDSDGGVICYCPKVDSASFTLSSSLFRNSVSSENGGALFVDSTSHCYTFLIRNNTFDNCECGGSCDGGAIYLKIKESELSNPIVSACSFIDCKKALYLDIPSSQTIHSSYFAFSDGYALKWIESGEELSLKSCVFNKNTLICEDVSNMIFDNCYSNADNVIINYPTLIQTNTPEAQYERIYNTYMKNQNKQSYIDLSNEATPYLKGSSASVTNLEDVSFDGMHKSEDRTTVDSRIMNPGFLY